MQTLADLLELRAIALPGGAKIAPLTADAVPYPDPRTLTLIRQCRTGQSVHTVIETPAFLASASDEGIDDEERSEIVSQIAQNPTAGVMMRGTGGARKIRVAGRGKGKSGGYRVITFFAGDDIPVFLLDVYGKDSQANLSSAQRNELKKLLAALPQAWRAAIKQRPI